MSPDNGEADATSPTSGQGPGGSHVFIVGAARTGSTLLRHVLNQAPGVCIASETHFFRWAHAARLDILLQGTGGAPGNPAEIVAQRLLSADFWPWLRRNVSAPELTDRLRSGGLARSDVFSLLLSLYAERGCDAGQQRAVVLGEKTPEHLANVPELVSWFPRSRIIHTFRDPRAIYASQLSRLREGRWGPKSRWPWLPGPLVDPLLAPIEAVRTVVAWRNAARLHRRYAAALGERYRLVRFEDLVNQPDDELQRVCQFIGITYRPQMLEGVDIVGSSFQAARHASRGFDRETSSRWRTMLGPLTRSWFQATLGREMASFGYVT